MNQTAQGLAALGRGPDTMLVHMAPEEVAGLQALALKHGGTLTINPETGLAEAGFLKSILPMIAGFALGPAGFGMSSAMAGLTVGGITALTSKSLEKGLMAGLGAYGGAGLAEGFANAGTGAMSSAAGAGAPQVAAESIVPQAVAPAVAAPTSAVSAANVAPNLFGGTESEIAKAYGYPVASPLEAAKTVATVTPQISPAELAAQAVREQNAAAFMNEQAQQQAVAKALANKTDLVSAGFDVAKNAPGAFLKKNMLPLGALGIAALSSSDDKKGTPGLSSPGLIRPYTYARTKNKAAFEDVQGDPMSSRERQYFNDQYTAQTPYRAPGPEYMAVGGPVEDMSNNNDMAAYMGQDKFDQGGSVGGYAFDPRTGRYIRPGGATSVGGYTYDPMTGLYTRPGGQGATTVPPREIASGDSDSSGGSDPNQGPKTDWGAILGDPSLTGKDWPDLTPEQQAKAASIVDPYGIGQGIKGLASMFVPGFSLFSALGDAANRMFGKQDPELAKVEDAVPKSVDEILNGVIVGNPIKDGPTVIQDLPPALGPVYSYTGDDSMDFGGPPSGNTSSDTGVGNPGESSPSGGPDGGPSGGSVGADYGGPADGGIGGSPADADPGAGGYSSDPGGGGGADGGGDGGGGGGSDSEARGGLNLNGRYYPPKYAQGGIAALAYGGLGSLGSYSDGGRLLRGPGDGVSDSIPAMIGQKQKARLADGEFVIPARIVSELGNGSTEAGARQLYAMMDRVQKARRKTVGKDKVATNSRAAKLLPA